MDKIIKNIISIIKEAKAKDVDPKLIAWIEKRYGPWDDRDFISDDGDTYFKTDADYESEGGGISHSVIKLPSFGELIKQLKDSRDAANDLVRGESVRDDEVLRAIYDQQKDTYNKFRTHLRKEYPAFYAQLKGQLTEEEIEEISTSGAAGAFLTPYAFKKPKKKQEPIPENLNKDEIPSYLTSNKAFEKAVGDSVSFNDFEKRVYGILGPKYFKLAKIENPGALKDFYDSIRRPKNLNEDINLDAYGYKLVPKDKAGNYVQKGSKLDVVNLFEDVKSFQKERIKSFDVIEQELNDIYKMLSNAKNETSDYYNDNPSSYAVVRPTDLVLDYIKDIKDLLKGE